MLNTSARLVPLFVAAGLLPGCGGPGSPAYRLSSVSTALEEKAVFEDISRSSQYVGFTPRGATGMQIQLTQPGWEANVATIDIDLGEISVTHRVIDPSNLWILMQDAATSDSYDILSGHL